MRTLMPWTGFRLALGSTEPTRVAYLYPNAPAHVAVLILYHLPVLPAVHGRGCGVRGTGGADNRSGAFRPGRGQPRRLVLPIMPVSLLRWRCSPGCPRPVVDRRPGPGLERRPASGPAGETSADPDAGRRVAATLGLTLSFFPADPTGPPDALCCPAGQA